MQKGIGLVGITTSDRPARKYTPQQLGAGVPLARYRELGLRQHS